MVTDLKKTEDLIKLATAVLDTRWKEDGTVARHRVDPVQFSKLRSGALSLIHRLYGIQHPFYSEFDLGVKHAEPVCVERGLGILQAIRAEQV